MSGLGLSSAALLTVPKSVAGIQPSWNFWSSVGSLNGRCFYCFWDFYEFFLEVFLEHNYGFYENLKSPQLKMRWSPWFSECLCERYFPQSIWILSHIQITHLVLCIENLSIIVIISRNILCCYHINNTGKCQGFWNINCSRREHVKVHIRVAGVSSGCTIHDSANTGEKCNGPHNYIMDSTLVFWLLAIGFFITML